MTTNIDNAIATVHATWAFVTAGASALGALASRYIADAMPLPPGTERLLDLGFAGIFIIALLWGMKIQWTQRLADQDRAAAREEKLIALIAAKEAQMTALEKEVREVLRADLLAADRSRQEMLSLMKRKEERETA